jgi:hypothetical protein
MVGALGVDIVRAIGDLLGAIAWPAGLAGSVAMLVFTRAGRRLIAVFGARIRRVSGPGFTVELTEEAATHLRTSIEDVFDDVRQETKREFNRLAHVYGVPSVLGRVATEAITPVIGGDIRFRATVYVPDALFADALYCLTDYWPDGGGAGRAFHMRYGIIGRVWRLGQSEVADVPANRDRLIKEWGMTSAEARDQNPSSFLALLLRHDDLAVGVLFADARPGVFQQTQHKQFADAEAVRHLAAVVHDTAREVRRRAPVIRVLDR